MRSECGFIDGETCVRVAGDVWDADTDPTVDVVELATDPDGLPWHGPLTAGQLEDVCERMTADVSDRRLRQRQERQAALTDTEMWRETWAGLRAAARW